MIKVLIWDRGLGQAVAGGAALYQDGMALLGDRSDLGRSAAEDPLGLRAQVGKRSAGVSGPLCNRVSWRNRPLACPGQAGEGCRGEISPTYQEATSLARAEAGS